MTLMSMWTYTTSPSSTPTTHKVSSNTDKRRKIMGKGLGNNHGSMLTLLMAVGYALSKSWLSS